MYGCNWDWDSFPNAARTDEDAARDLAKARENSPQRVLGEMGLVLAFALGAALAINVILSALHVS
jgi:hypothetical protein